jgi:hypothetical protein
MLKRKCEFCRHFEPNGVAGSGWCQHPKRRDIKDMVFVRKSELACRNDWDQDLFEQRASAPRDDALPTRLVPIGIAGGSGVDITAEHGRRPSAASDALKTGDMYTDKVESIVVVPGPRARPQVAPVPAASVGADRGADENDGVDPRSAVRTARRRLQEQRAEQKKREQQHRIERAGLILAGETGSETEPQATADPPSLDRPGDPPTPARVIPKSLVPDPPAPKVQRTPDVQRRIVTPRGGDGGGSIEFKAAPPTFRNAAPPPTRPARPEPTTRGELPEHSRPTPAEVGRRTQTRSNDGDRTEPLPSPLAAQDRRLAAPPMPPVVPEKSARRSAVRPLRASTTVEGADGSGGSARTSAGTTTEDRRTRRQVNQPLALPVDPIDAAPQLASVQRCCGTCREFKRDGDSSYGWCSSSYALPEPRMVESSELACRSALGVWWLAHDDWWLERADTSHHGRPTPWLDYEVRTGTISKLGKRPRSR